VLPLKSADFSEDADNGPDCLDFDAVRFEYCRLCFVAVLWVFLLLAPGAVLSDSVQWLAKAWPSFEVRF
jgi:hypothetical protein